MSKESTPKGAPEAVAAESIVAAQAPDTGCCHADEYGLLDLRCLWALLAAEERAYAEGYAKGRTDHADQSWTLACQIVNGAARSIDIMAARAKPYTIPRWAS